MRKRTDELAAAFDVLTSVFDLSTHENTPYLPGITLSDLVLATTDVSVATEDADIVFVVVPTPFIRGEWAMYIARYGGILTQQ